MAIRIFIDQGHNPYGFHTGTERFGLREQDITYIVGVYLADILKSDPRFEVTVSRQTPDEILGYNSSSSLYERVNMANAWNADYFISLHVNSNENINNNGTEAHIYIENTPAYGLAKSIVSEIVQDVGTKNNNVRVNHSLYVLKKTTMPAISVELAYITNYEDCILLSNALYLFAHAIYKGILKYLYSTSFVKFTK